MIYNANEVDYEDLIDKLENYSNVGKVSPYVIINHFIDIDLYKRKDVAVEVLKIIKTMKPDLHYKLTALWWEKSASNWEEYLNKVGEIGGVD
jgi:hypothetical protein